MGTFRIALANLRFPASPEESVALAEKAVEQAAAQRAWIVCFPECFVPGYRGMGKSVAAADAAFLNKAWSRVAASARKSGVAVILGTERIVDGGLRITAMVIDHDGKTMGFQDKVQLDPSEESIYSPGSERHTFESGELTFGVAICHEGWRYPETVRWAVRRGAQIVFHPHFHEAESGSYAPTRFADPANSFHQKSNSVPRRGEHFLLRKRKLCECRIANYFRGDSARRHALELSAVWQRRFARRRH
jgi:predicted amidohydrolase